MARIGVLWPDTMGYVMAGLREIALRGHETALYALRTTDEFKQGPHGGVDVFDIGRTGMPRSDQFDLALVCGWHVPEFRAWAGTANCPTGLYFDTHWTGSPRQRFGRQVASWFIHRRFEFAFVPGQLQADFARRIGFSDDRIFWRGLTFDSAFLGVETLTSTGLAGREQFLFAGRLVPEKGIAALVEAYERYREDVTDPWQLAIAGHGPEHWRLERSTAPIRVLGHLSTPALAAEMQRSGCFVLPSRFEPYGVVIQEAAAAGLPVITTSRAGAATEVVEPGLTGHLAVAGDPRSLAARMHEVSRSSAECLASAGERGRLLALSRTPEHWADSLLSVLSRQSKD